MTKAARRYKSRSRKLSRMSKRARARARTRPSKSLTSKIKKVIFSTSETKTTGLLSRNTAPTTSSFAAGALSIPRLTASSITAANVASHLPVISPLSQGVGEFARVGDSIFVKYAQMRVKIKLGTYNSSNVYGIDTMNNMPNAVVSGVNNTNSIWIHEVIPIKGMMNQLTLQANAFPYATFIQNLQVFFYDTPLQSGATLNANSFRAMCTYRPLLDAKAVGFWVKRTKRVALPLFGSGLGNTTGSEGMIMTQFSTFPKYFKSSLRNKTCKYNNDAETYPYNINSFILLINDSAWSCNLDFENYMSYKDI